MADEADMANDYIDNEVLRALRTRQNSSQKPGSKNCKSCGESIPDARRQMGFQFCIECAEETERRKSLFAD